MKLIRFLNCSTCEFANLRILGVFENLWSPRKEGNLYTRLHCSVFLTSAILRRNSFIFSFFIFPRFEKHVYLFLMLKNYYVILEEAGFKC